MLKILLTYNNISDIFTNNIFLPIHTGREISTDKEKQFFEKILGDNTSDNISNKNKEYCELTAIYWAWKNYEEIGNPDYIGIMSSKRLLNINNNNIFEIPGMNNETINSIGYFNNNIEMLLKKYDIFLPEIYNVHPESIDSHIMNSYSFYKRNHISEDLDNIINIINSEHKEYELDMNNYLNDTKSMFFHFFVMKKEIFFQYCEWLFSILFKYETMRGDRREIEEYQNRDIKYLSKILLNIFIRHYIRINNAENNVKYCKIVNVLQKIDEIDFSKVKLGNKDVSKINKQKVNYNNKINIVYSSDNNYAQHCCCSIASILLNSDDDSYLNFIILDGGISEKNKNKIISLKNIKEFNIKFYDMKSVNFYDGFKLNREYISISTYYRLIMLNILDNDIDKLIYIDCDTIVETNIKKLWDIDIENYSALVVDDECGISQCLRLALPVKNRYFNAGILVLNISKLRESNFYNDCIKCYQDNEELITLQDQDILNIVLNGKCKYLDLNWNTNTRVYLGSNLKGFDTPHFKRYYSIEDSNNAKYNPYVIHYTDSIKPWNINCKKKIKNEYFEYLKFTKFSSFIIKYYFNKYIFNYYKDFKYLRIKFLFIHLTIKKKDYKNK